LIDYPTEIGAAIDQIGALPVVWTRAALTRSDTGSWTAPMLELTSGEAPPGWSREDWRYPSARLFTTAERGETIAQWLSERRVKLGDVEAELPPPSTSVRWERRASRSPSAYAPLDWPCVETQLAPPQGYQPDGTEHLLSGEGAPSFVNFANAAAYFFGLDRVPMGGSFHHGTVYRHQDRAGRVQAVQIRSDVIAVRLSGDALDGLTLDLAGDAPGVSTRVWDRPATDDQTIEFQLDDGVPAGAWLVLRDGSDWKDRRFLAMPWSQPGDDGVEVVVDPMTRLEAFLANREGGQSEFKRLVPDERDGKRKLMKTVCAFANGSGGSILFGIDDDHEVVGVPLRQVGSLKDDLTMMVDSWIDPTPQLSFAELPCEDDHMVVLELAVPAGDRLSASGLPVESRRVYVRHHATSVPARPHEIEEIVRRRSPPSGHALLR